MIACAADEIFADPASIVGSIGVVSASFGFDELIERFGIERRVHTAGENKAMLDPFRPENPEDVERLKALQAQDPRGFRRPRAIAPGRKAADDAYDDLFSGAFWVGAEAVDLGLDRRPRRHPLRHARALRRQGAVPHDRARPPRRCSGRLLGRRAVGDISLIDPGEVVGALEERAAWARLGL